MPNNRPPIWSLYPIDSSHNHAARTAGQNTSHTVPAAHQVETAGHKTSASMTIADAQASNAGTSAARSRRTTRGCRAGANVQQRRQNTAAAVAAMLDTSRDSSHSTPWITIPVAIPRPTPGRRWDCLRGEATSLPERPSKAQSAAAALPYPDVSVLRPGHRSPPAAGNSQVAPRRSASPCPAVSSRHLGNGLASHYSRYYSSTSDSGTNGHTDGGYDPDSDTGHSGLSGFSSIPQKASTTNGNFSSLFHCSKAGHYKVEHASTMPWQPPPSVPRVHSGAILWSLFKAMDEDGSELADGKPSNPAGARADFANSYYNPNTACLLSCCIEQWGMTHLPPFTYAEPDITAYAAFAPFAHQAVSYPAPVNFGYQTANQAGMSETLNDSQSSRHPNSTPPSSHTAFSQSETWSSDPAIASQAPYPDTVFGGRPDPTPLPIASALGRGPTRSHPSIRTPSRRSSTTNQMDQVVEGLEAMAGTMSARLYSSAGRRFATPVAPSPTPSLYFPSFSYDQNSLLNDLEAHTEGAERLLQHSVQGFWGEIYHQLSWGSDRKSVERAAII